MTILERPGAPGLVVVGLGPDELLLESIRAAIASKGIRNGAVVACAGTLKSCRLHYVDHTGFPPKDVFDLIEGPLELVGLSGLIASGEPHLHVVVSMRDQPARAGHLEDGSRVLYLAEVMILRDDALAMTRRLDEARKVKLLGPA